MTTVYGSLWCFGTTLYPLVKRTARNAMRLPSIDPPHFLTVTHWETAR